VIKRFQQCDVGDHQGVPDIIASMKELLDALDGGAIPNDTDYSLEDLAGYLTSLVEGQRGSVGRTMPGSWAVVPDDDGMPSDVRVEFIFTPTYIATATLTRGLCDHPLIALAIPGYREALQTGMLFCAARNLQGHGYDATDGVIDALGILSLGKVPWLLERDPAFCPELKAAIDEAARYMARCLTDGTATGSWSEDYTDGFTSVLETLRVTNDLDYILAAAADGQDPAEPPATHYERFCEQITMTSVADTVAKLLTHPFGFHGDTGIRDYLYARLHAHGGARLSVDDPRPGFSTLLLQSEHYTRAHYIGIGQAPRGARFDLALTLPPEPSGPIEDRCAERLSALFAFELGKNKATDKVIDPDMLAHAVDATPGTSDVSKLYRELMHHDLAQGWAIEFYDARGTSGAATISSALELCKGLTLPEGKKLVVVFVGFSADGKHHVSSNDAGVQTALIGQLARLGIEAGPDPVSSARRPASAGGGSGWTAATQPSATVEEVFEDRAEFAERIIRTGGMEECGRKLRYVNLSCAGKMNIAQIHPQADGIALALKRRGDDLPATLFEEIPVASLAGYKGANARWLDGSSRPYDKKGPAVAFLVPDEVDELGDDDPEWQDVARLLEHAKTLA
jgi:hypothetical protein